MARSSRFYIYFGIAGWAIILNLYLFLYHYDDMTLKNAFPTSSKYKNKFGYDNYYESEIELSNSHSDDDKENKWAFVSHDNENEEPELYHYHPVNTSILNHKTFDLYKMQAGLKDLRDIPTHFSSNYEAIFKNHPDPNVVLGNLDFNERCSLYFKNLFVSDHKWKLDPNEKLPLGRYIYPYDIAIEEFEFNIWKEHQIDELIEQYKLEIEFNEEEDDSAILDTDEIEKFILLKYKLFWNTTYSVEQKSLDMISHLRIFNKCFLSKDDTNQEKETKQLVQNQKHLIRRIQGTEYLAPFEYSENERMVKLDQFNECSNLERRLFPWYSFQQPMFVKWNGEVELKPPVYNNNPTTKMTSTGTHTQYTDSCYFNEIKESLNGRGIVLTLGDIHLENTLNLIKLLRALGNKLPIQIVYYEHLSGEAKLKIVKTAREPIRDFPASIENVRHLLPHDYEKGLPVQNIHFVNVHNVVDDAFHVKFEGYGNKLLATLFNSFEEFILLDSDVVLFKHPEWFFNNEKYKAGGALFYKDRAATEKRPETDIYFLKMLLPSLMDNAMFGFPMVTSKTLNNDAFEGMYHFMESGVVVLNKYRHFNSLLMLPQLYFMEPLLKRSHGDKEFFWWAFAFNGNEDYVFNEYRAAAVGEVKPERRKDNGELYLAQQLCNAHPAHLDDNENSLVWLNSGFHFCGKYDLVDYENDIKEQANYYLKTFETQDEMKQYYYDPINIRHGVIPPFSNPHHLRSPNEQGEPEYAWQMLHVLCHDYMWCTYSSIGYGDNFQNGTVIEFDEDEHAYFKFLGDVWVGAE